MSKYPVAVINKDVLDNSLQSRADRYAQAMAALGHSRILELLPLASLVAPAKGALLDLMSGTGFVSRYLGNPFNLIHAIDKIHPSAIGGSQISRYLKCDAAQSDIIEVVRFKYDTIISLAGFHHLLPERQMTFYDEEQVTEYRVDCLRRWRNLLKDGGRLIIADVPTPGQTAYEAIRANPMVSVFPELQSALEVMPFAQSNLFLDSQPEPALFFDEFVAYESITPHVASFESSSSLSSLLERAGYTNIKTGIYFTPWCFQSPNEAAWFLHNLFGIGAEQYDLPDLMPWELVEQIHRAVEVYLGSWYINGGFWIGWKLLYTTAETNG